MMIEFAHRLPLPGAIAFTLLVCLLFSAFVSDTQAAERMDSFDGWCRGQFGNEWMGQRSTETGGPICARRIQGGLGLEYRRVSESDVCPGSTVKLNDSGSMYVCRDRTPPGEGPQNLTAYCVDKHGTGWKGTTNRITGKPLCTKQEGLSLKHREVDEADLCPGGSASVDGTGSTFTCGGETRTETNDGSPPANNRSTEQGGRNAGADTPDTNSPEIERHLDAGAFADCGAANPAILARRAGLPDDALSGPNPYADPAIRERVSALPFIVADHDWPCTGQSGGVTMDKSEVCAAQIGFHLNAHSAETTYIHNDRTRFFPETHGELLFCGYKYIEGNTEGWQGFSPLLACRARRPADKPDASIFIRYRHATQEVECFYIGGDDAEADEPKTLTMQVNW